MGSGNDRDNAIPGNQILDDTICQQDLKITNTPTDGQIIKINMPTGDFTAIDEPTGSGGASGSTFLQTFVNGDLTADKITITHNLSTSHPVIAVYDNSENIILPTEITYLTDDTIEIDLSGIAPITGTYTVRVVGSGGTTGAFLQTFADGDLTAGVLTANHNLSTQYVLVRIYDNNNKIIEADEYIATDGNNLSIDLSSFGTLTGNWNVIISTGGSSGAGTASAHGEEFADGDLTAGILTITHNLNTQYVNITIYNNLGKKIMPDDVTATSTSVVTIDLNSFGTLTGNWNIKVVG